MSGLFASLSQLLTGLRSRLGCQLLSFLNLLSDLFLGCCVRLAGRGLFCGLGFRRGQLLSLLQSRLRFSPSGIGLGVIAVESFLRSLLCGSFGNVLRFLPPLSLGDELLTEALDVLTEVIAGT